MLEPNKQICNSGCIIKFWYIIVKYTKVNFNFNTIEQVQEVYHN